MDKVTVTVDLPKSVCAAMGVRESELVRVMREVLAVELYRLGRMSLGKAAEVAGVSQFEMMQLLTKHDAWLAYDVQDAAEDWDVLRKVLPK